MTNKAGYISFYIRNESREERGLITRKIKQIPCFRVYRNDGACDVTYDNIVDAIIRCDKQNEAYKYVTYEELRQTIELHYT